ncbi:hypothetical protein [Hymenobacter glacieicola]|uniref:Uncharacterized protein n=1 Tax=Hymenobacter glacieicola TaxID=1562124 RepID=A0ABQ1WJJ3_9BACT|nr:hypothetical protein [Hymenobacter glacieicola]GGG34294.1 hypothetical protein GCM10011378_08390 [Hymenobacter glacieicola]
MLLFISTLPIWLQFTLAFVPLVGVPLTLLSMRASLRTIRREREDALVEATRTKAEEKAALEARLTDYKQFKERHATEVSDLNGKYEKDRATMLVFTGTQQEFQRDLDSFKLTLHQNCHDITMLQSMPSRVQSLETKLDNLTTQISDLKQGQQLLRKELREDMHRDKSEIIDAIRNIRH